MHRLQPQSALLLVIAMIIQLLAVTVASAQAVSAKTGAAQQGDRPHDTSHAGQMDTRYSEQATGDCSMLELTSDTGGQTTSGDCTADNNCLLVHCSSAHALTEFYLPLSVKEGSLRLSVAPQPRVVPQPPRVRPPKSV